MPRRCLTGGWILIVVALALGASAPGAHAAPNERAAAKAFADAAREYTREVWTGVPALRAASDADAENRAACPRFASYFKGAKRQTERQVDRALTLVMLQAFLPVYRELLPPAERMVAALEVVATRDPALRSGRAIWRQRLAEIRRFAAWPRDVCLQLVAWNEAGAKGLPLPTVDLGDFNSISGRPRASGGLSQETRIARAVARLRALGQGPRRAARFTGDATDRALEPVLLRQFAGISFLFDEG